MASESFEVTLTDEQLEAARASSAARGVNLGPVGSLSRDGVTLNYTTTSDGAGSNTVAVTVLYRPFYVPLDTIQSWLTDLLTNPTAAEAAKESPAEPAAEAVEQSSRRSGRHRE